VYCVSAAVSQQQTFEMLSCAKRLRKELEALNNSEDENIELSADEVRLTDSCVLLNMDS
jgi:hypothetical protein